MDKINVMNLFDKIVYHHKEMTGLMDELQKELFGSELFNTNIKEKRYEICRNINDNVFVKIEGLPAFNTADEAVNFVNSFYEKQIVSSPLYDLIKYNKRIYIHSIRWDNYKKLRKDNNGKYYLKNSYYAF